MALEEPVFEALERDGNIELRQYHARIVAETFVAGSLNAATKIGFRRIASYIAGNNQSGPSSAGKSSEKIAMTAPLTVEPVLGFEKIAMAQPLLAQLKESVNGSMMMKATRWRIHLVLPKRYSLASLPRPNNSAVTLREVPGKRFAVLIFSGFSGEAKVQQNIDALSQWLKTKGLRTSASPQLARYDSSWTLPFLRRNEILVEMGAD